MSQPLVSVILPTYCRAASGHLSRAIESLLAQDFGQFELIAVDDGSRDGTRDILEDFARRDRRIALVRLNRHLGFPAQVTAHGYLRAGADTIAWLFDDCELAPGSLAARYAALAAHTSVDMVYGPVELQQDGEARRIGAPVDMANLARANNMIPNVSVLMRRAAIERFGWYDPHVILKRFCDWDLWHRIIRGGGRALFLDALAARECGVGLGNSIGRSVPLRVPLMLRYAATDRNARLSPRQVIDSDPFSEDWVPELGSEDLLEQRLLAVDHCLRNDELATLAKLVVGWRGGRSVGRSATAGSPDTEIAWAAALYLRERDNLSAEIAAIGSSLRQSLAESDRRLGLLRAAEARAAWSEGARAALLAQANELQRRLAAHEAARAKASDRNG